MMSFATAPLRWLRPPVPLDLPPPVQAPRRGRAAVFVDQDGALVDALPGNVDPARLALRPGAAEALAALAAQGFALLVVTHQSGLARGHFTRAQFARLQAALQQRLRDAAAVELLDLLVCPHAPAPDGRPLCLCRTPAPGLLLRAARQHGIDLARSWLVGGTRDDVEAGHRAGCGTLLLADGDSEAAAPRLLHRPDLHCASWAGVAQQLRLMPAEPAPL